VRDVSQGGGSELRRGSGQIWFEFLAAELPTVLSGWDANSQSD
jgi:hypothetical protein